VIVHRRLIDVKIKREFDMMKRLKKLAPNLTRNYENSLETVLDQGNESSI
jgi:hypothetical protein